MTKSAESDEMLVVLAGRGDRGAATVLIERHTRKIHAQCYRMLQNQAAAEDAVQEVFLRVWRHAKRWNSNGAKFETWLYRVAANYCLDQLRKKKHEVGDDGLIDVIDGADGPGEILAASQQHAMIVKALNKLPDRQRMAIALCYLQEMSNAEAAEIMGIGLQAMESLLARARRELRESLAPEKHILMEDTRDDALKITG